MLVVISPAKKLDFETQISWSESSKPAFLNKTQTLVTELQKCSAQDISKLMSLSPALSELNYKRFQNFQNKYNTNLSKQAIFAFNGDTYTGLEAQTLSQSDLKASQQKLRILSGLYGILKPDDLIQPYRLEMGTKFKFKKYKNLYDYWQADITEKLKLELSDTELLVNCASNEYFKAVNKKEIHNIIITPQFLDAKNGEYKMISFFAKKARGMMARFIIQNNCESLADIQNFNLDGYMFNKALTTDKHSPVFTRD